MGRKKATPGGYGGKPPGVAIFGVPTGARNTGTSAPTGDQSAWPKLYTSHPWDASRVSHDPISRRWRGISFWLASTASMAERSGELSGSRPALAPITAMYGKKTAAATSRALTGHGALTTTARMRQTVRMPIWIRYRFSRRPMSADSDGLASVTWWTTLRRRHDFTFPP